MGEADIIKATGTPGTIGTLYRDFANLGVKKGDILLVHSSLSRIGWVCGGPYSVVCALLKATGAGRGFAAGDDPDGGPGAGTWSEAGRTDTDSSADQSGSTAGAGLSVREYGTLVMPAHSGDLSDPAEWAHPPVPKDWIPVIYGNMPAYDPKITPTRGMGRIAELFRSFPGVLRSDHPQVSFCAKGKAARAITEGHPLSPQFGMESPLGKMYDAGAKVLLLGVGYDSCTSFHLSETFLAGMPVKRMGTAMLENGKRVWKWFEDYAYDSDDFNSIGEAFEEKCAVTGGRVGNAECRLFDMKSGVNFAAEWLGRNRKFD